jgi:osmotically-inducible protein OsmY
MPLIVGGTVGTAGYVAMRDKNIGESLNDTKIETTIQSRLYKTSPDFFSNVSVSSDNGCVLLTGIVEKEEWIAIAEKEAWNVRGVNVVDNNIISGKILGINTIMKDAAITSNARTCLLMNKNIRSVNYKIKTVGGIIYLRGAARTRAEIDSAINSVRRVRGVKKVVSYVNIMN